MTFNHDPQPLNLIDETQASLELKKSVHWLRRSRIEGTGPRYRKIGGHVLYDKADVLAWLRSHQPQISTKEKNP